MNAKILFLVAAAALVVLAGCQTVKPVAQQSMIRTDSSGFAPEASWTGHNMIAFTLTFGNADLVKTWKVQVNGPSGTTRTFMGGEKSLPGSLTWDGHTDTGSLATEGAYTASLSIDYGGTLPVATATSATFLLERTAPMATLSVNPSEFTPGAQGMTSPLMLTVYAKLSLAKISGWTIKIYDAGDALFRTFSGTWPDHTVSWDGKGASGAYVQPSMVFCSCHDQRRIRP